MDRFLPGIISGIVVLAVGFVVFYLFIEYYAKKRLMGDKSIDEKLQKLDEILPFIDDIMKKGVELENEIVPEYIGSENDIVLQKEIEIDRSDAKELEQTPKEVSKPEPSINHLVDTLYERL